MGAAFSLSLLLGHRMAFNGFMWMIRIFKHLTDRKEVSPLPNELIAEIVTRLPADQVLKFRKVSRRWEVLTLTPRFTLLHATHAPSISFLQYISPKKEYFYFLDAKAEEKMLERVCLESTLPVGQEFKLIGCCNGLVLFGAFQSWRRAFFICNPFKPGQFILREPEKPGYVCGIYFHLLTRDFRVLYVSKINNHAEYLVFSLRALQWRTLYSFAHWPKPGVAPVSIRGIMHWMVEHEPVIMTFTIETEEFNVGPYPGGMCHSRPRAGVQLLQMGSRLAFCNLCCKKIGVWVLEDYVDWVWVNRHVVHLEWDLNYYPFSPHGEINNDIKIVTIENGELVLFWACRGLFRYHLQLNTIEKIPVRGLKLDIKSTNSLFMTSYTKSFITLRLRNFASSHDIEKFGKL